jgi:cytochrome c5
MNNALKAIVLATGVAALAGAAQAQPPMEKYNKSCVVCHDQGVAGAPKTGDAEAWAPRLEKGMDTLMASVKNGLNAMPPMGMCMDCTDEDYMALIEYMSGAE